MYARYECRHLIGTGTEAKLLVKLLTSQAVLLQNSPDSLDGVRGLGSRIKDLLEKAACTSTAKAAVCSSVWRERSIFPLTVMTPHGPGILSLR